MPHPHEPDFGSRTLCLEQTGRRQRGFVHSIRACLQINRDDLAAISRFYQGAYLLLINLVPQPSGFLG